MLLLSFCICTKFYKTCVVHILLKIELGYANEELNHKLYLISKFLLPIDE